MPELARREKFDLAYADPPFNAGGKRAARVGKGERVAGQHAYDDAWSSVEDFFALVEELAGLGIDGEDYVLPQVEAGDLLDALKPLADDVSEQVKLLRDRTEGLLREHRKGIIERQFQQKRIHQIASDIFAQVAVLSRVSDIFEDQGVEPSGQERYIADTFCSRAAGRVSAAFDQIESNDDERMAAIAKLAYKRGEYGYALFED